MINETFMQLAKDVHADSVNAGWWTQLSTGQSLLPREIKVDDKVAHTWKRDPVGLMGLVHSEISEAWEAEFFDSYDDHLPQYKGEGVELADALIRLFDVSGAYNFNLLKLEFLDLDGEESHVYDCVNYQLDQGYCAINAFVSRAVEGFRKNNLKKAERNVNIAIIAIFQFSLNKHRPPGAIVNLYDLIEAKRDYNRNRADHKIENRLKPDGKKL